MGITAYHGTNALREILTDGAVKSFNAAWSRTSTAEQHDPWLSRNKQEYLAAVQGLTTPLRSLGASQSNVAEELLRTQHGLTLERVTDEQLADLSISAPKSGGAEPRSKYREARRVNHVWLGSYRLAVVAGQGSTTSNYAVLEFDIPFKKVRNGFTGDCILVWWQLSLDHMVKIYSKDPRHARNLLRERRYKIPVVEL